MTFFMSFLMFWIIGTTVVFVMDLVGLKGIGIKRNTFSKFVLDRLLLYYGSWISLGWLLGKYFKVMIVRDFYDTYMNEDKNGKN